MKKFRLLVTLLAVFTVITLTGCGSKTDLSKYAGTYKGEYTKMVGDDTKDTSDKFSVELKADGTGSSTRDGSTYDIEWSLDGDKFTMTEKFATLKIEYNGKTEYLSNTIEIKGNTPPPQEEPEEEPPENTD